MNRVRVVGFLGCAAWPTMNAPSHPQDREAVVPEMQVLLQNEHVRVQFHDVAVGETTPMHSHPAYVAYVFNACTAKAILPDGKAVPLNRKPSDVFYSGPVTHRIANTGTTAIHNLIVESTHVAV